MYIYIFDTLGDALSQIEACALESKEYFKAEIYRTDDGRFRVGIIDEQQMELDF